MSSSSMIGARDDEIFAISKKGDRELKSAGTSLSATELQVLVLVDGFSSVAQIAQRMPSISREELTVALRKLADSKLVVSITEADAMASGFSTIAIPAGFFSGLTAGSNPEADGGLAALQKSGYYVRIARRPVQNSERKEGWLPTILVVDDDQDLQKLIRTYLMMEGFKTRAAFKRDDILIALRQQPTPDLILLDVRLPDANGFDVLAQMRLHPALKSMPIIMLTAEASREAVLKGLRAGADGYVTKPFQPDQLVSAVNAVLGISARTDQK